MTASHYEILSVARDASTDDVKKAHRQAATAWRLARVGKQEQDQDGLAAIDEALRVLSDPDLRSAYDRSLEAYQARLKYRPPTEMAGNGKLHLAIGAAFVALAGIGWLCVPSDTPAKIAEREAVAERARMAREAVLVAGKTVCPVQKDPKINREGKAFVPAESVKVRVMVHNGSVKSVEFLSGSATYQSAIREAIEGYACQNTPPDAVFVQQFEFRAWRP